MNIFQQSTQFRKSPIRIMKCCRFSSKPAGWHEARPLSECPQVSGWELIRGFMPGGKLKDMDNKTMIETAHEDKGPIIYTPPYLRKPGTFTTKNPEDFETILRNEDKWPHRLGFEMLSHCRNEIRKDFFGEKSGLLVTNGKNWGDIRTAVNPILMHPKNVKAYLPIMNEVTGEFIERIKARRDPKTLEVPDTFQDDINRWTLESVATVALDTKLNLLKNTDPDSSQYFKNLLRLFDLIMKLEVKPSLWRYLPNKYYNEFVKCYDEVTVFTEVYIAKAMDRIRHENAANEKPDLEKSVLERLLNVDKKLAIVMAMDMLMAGVTTTTTAFTGILFNLAKNPDKQEKLRDEMFRLLPEKNSSPTVENMKNLPYLRACIKESLRIYPVGVVLGRIIQSDMVLSGYQVPAGTAIRMANSLLTSEESQFGKPKEFIPERWLRTSEPETVDGCSLKANNPFVYLPFGFGLRSCIGRRIAEMEMEMGIAHIIRNFRLEYNHPMEKPFYTNHIYTPNIPLKFKFTDVGV